jgi:hypothetical protein
MRRMPLEDPNPLAQHRSRPAEIQVRIQLANRGIPFLAYRDAAANQQIVALTSDIEHVHIGRDQGLTVALPWDGESSSLHAEVRRVGQHWVLADLGSTNGTYVNDARLLGPHRLAHLDLVRIGLTYLAYRHDAGHGELTLTKRARDYPPVTFPEKTRPVLSKLCRPILLADGEAKLPGDSEIARELSVAVVTVKMHLREAAKALKITESAPRARRKAIAEAAVNRGIVTRRDLL